MADAEPKTTQGMPGMISMTADNTSLAVENAVAARRFIEEVMSQGNLSLLGQLVTADFVLHHPQSPEPVRGVEAFKALLGMWRTAFPDVRLKIEELFAVEDRAAVRVTCSGTHTGSWLEHAPTGKRATWSATHLMHMRGGRIGEIFVDESTLSLMRQLGLMGPGPGRS